MKELRELNVAVDSAIAELNRLRALTMTTDPGDQSHLDKMDTDGRHKWLALFRIPCKCKECRDETDS